MKSLNKGGIHCAIVTAVEFLECHHGQLHGRAAHVKHAEQMTSTFTLVSGNRNILESEIEVGVSKVDC